MANVLEFKTVRRLSELSMVYVELIEEAAKLLVPIAVLIVARRWVNPADGLLVAVAVAWVSPSWRQ